LSERKRKMPKLLSSLYSLGIYHFLIHYRLKKLWESIKKDMTLNEVEKIMGFKFNLDSENKNGRMVYSNHEKYNLPFYLVVNKNSSKIISKHEISILTNLY
jgi:uncharacterized protein YprB with RNaseH-like and TPR domain